MKKTLIIFILLTLNYSFSFSQEYSDFAIEYFNNQLLDFNESQARNDIYGGKIILKKLLSEWTMHDNPCIDVEQIHCIEERFGFTYEYLFFEIPLDFLTPKQEAYNRAVYEHLDSLCNCDSRKEIKKELGRFSFENCVTSRRSDKTLKKIVRKEFRNKDKTLRTEAFEAEKLYTKRKYAEAYEAFSKIEEKLTTEKAKRFILTSKYHSLMNLFKFDEASKLLEKDTNNWINKGWK